MRDEETQGRRHLESPHPYRSEFQRDRDRIIHTKAFRRLENKTQVFNLTYSDHFRNRLTHTIEVSQIARTIAGALRLNTDFCEVLALSHDIGHPPFSHEGEKILQRCMKRYESGFDHNLHAIRIVEYFEEKYPAFRGLNLTFEVREGIVKHSRDYLENEETYLDISEYRLGERPPLEAQVIDLADEIAYNVADLDDGYDSGLLKLEQIVYHMTFFREFYGRVKKRYPHASETLLVKETVRQMLDALVTSLITHTRRKIVQEDIDSVDKVRLHSSRLLDLEDEMKKKNQEFKQFLHQHLYQHDILKAARRQTQRLIEDLFEYYVVQPEALPKSHYSRLPDLELHQLVCDYIAGMTDTYAQTKYAEIFQNRIA